MLANSEGKVLVLLLGMKGCPGTEAATPFLATYAAEKNGGVAVARVDVPPPGGGTLPKPPDIPVPLQVVLDNNRKIADRLKFFFYPTLYIVDVDGLVRYQGKCEEKTVRQMVSEILAEDPAEPKRMYTHPLPAVGAAASRFAGVNLAGARTSLANLRGEEATLLLFSATTCPFSIQAVKSLPELAAEFEGKGLAIVIVNLGQPADAVRSFYRTAAPGTTVVVDDTGSLSREGFAVTAVPFFYALDQKLSIATRKPYTLEAARAAVAGTLGIEISETESTGAG